MDPNNSHMQAAKKTYRKKALKRTAASMGVMGGIGYAMGGKKGALGGAATGAAIGALGHVVRGRQATREIAASRQKRANTIQARRAFAADVMDIIDRSFGMDTRKNKRSELAGLVLSNKGGYRRWRRVSSINSGKVAAYGASALGANAPVTAGVYVAAREGTRKAPEGSGLRRSKAKVTQGAIKSAIGSFAGGLGGDLAARGSAQLIYGLSEGKININQDLAGRVGRVIGGAEGAIRGYESVTPKFKKKGVSKRAMEIIRDKEMDW